MLRRMLYGTGGNRRSTAARPVMESVSPQQAEPILERNGNANNGGNGENAPSSTCLNACSLAMVYSPEQIWQEIYPVEKALGRGTLFRELDKPFEGRTLMGR